MPGNCRRVRAMLAVGSAGRRRKLLGAEGWFGINPGSIGATLLYAAACVFVLANAATQVFPEDWSPSQKQVWVGLVLVVLIAIALANPVAALTGLGGEADRLGMLIFGWSAIASMPREQDAGGVQFGERDLRIAHRTSRFADGTLALLVVRKPVQRVCTVWGNRRESE